MADKHEDDLPRAVALQNAQRIPAARQKAEEELQKQAELLRITLASIGDAVITTDIEGRVTSLNPIAVTLTGWTPEEAVGAMLEKVFRILNEKTRHPVENPALRALKDGVIVGLANHTILIAKDGTQRAIEDSAAPIRGIGGELVGCVLVFRDVTERRHAELKAEEALEFSVNIIDTIREPLLILNASLRVISASRSFYETFRVLPDATEGRLVYDLGNGQWNIPALRRLLEEILPHSTEFNDYEVAHDFPDIGKRVMLLNARRIHRRGNHTENILLAIEDITERQQAEYSLSESEERLRTMADNISQLAWVCDSLGNVTWYNRRWLEYTGLAFEDMKGWDWSKVQHPDHLDRVIAGVKRSAETGEPWDDTFPLRGKDGEYRWFLSRAVPIRDAHGNIVSWFGTNTDVTEARADQEALRETDRHKNEFLAMLAHELRNPLAPIRSAVQVLRLAGGKPEVVASVTDMMERQVGQMGRLVDDLLDVSRVSRGKIELRRGRVELASVVHHAVEAARSQMEAKEHEIAVTLPTKPLYVHGDPTRLAQMVGNLLNNACKFTDKGGLVSVTGKLEGALAVIRVRDSGIGMAASELPRIFDMFMQVDTSMERSNSGLGIGLTLVKSLVELHGGSVQAQSAGLGQGSEFTVRLPIVAEAPKAPSAGLAIPDTMPMIARRILVVDDNRDAAESLAMLLNLKQSETHIAHDGFEGVEAASTFKPDVVLLDIGMPTVNGYEACRRIREQPWGRSMILIALTGWGQDQDRQLSKEAGFDGHMVKPVDIDSLMSLLVGLENKANR